MPNSPENEIEAAMSGISRVRDIILRDDDHPSASTMAALTAELDLVMDQLATSLSLAHISCRGGRQVGGPVRHCTTVQNCQQGQTLRDCFVWGMASRWCTQKISFTTRGALWWALLPTMCISSWIHLAWSLTTLKRGVTSWKRSSVIFDLAQRQAI